MFRLDADLRVYLHREPIDFRAGINSLVMLVEQSMQRVEYDLPEGQKTCTCCGHSLHRIGEDISEQLHYKVKVTVVQNARFKYACRHCEAHAERTPILLAPMPAQPLPGSHASAAIIATVTAGSPRVAKALEYFQALDQVEALAKGELPEDETRIGYTHRLRQQHSVPLLNAFKDWLDELAPKVLPQSLLGKAIRYCRNQWPYLSRYVMDGHAPIDNNVIERDIRPFVTGRKSWLHGDTVAGAKASATVYSLMLTCRACGVEPYAHLLHVLTELPQRAPDTDISDLLPFNYAKRQAQANVS